MLYPDESAVSATETPLPAAALPDLSQWSIIIPVLNEAAGIVQCMRALQPLRRLGVVLIVVDGGSEDDTLALAAPWADRCLRSEAGRAIQMNHGAGYCESSLLLFLHADTRLPQQAAELLYQLSEARSPWGFFAIRLSGKARMLRLVERMISWRSRLTGIAGGDQALFVRRELFNSLGGFPALPLMEDIALCKRFSQRGLAPRCLSEAVVSSSRRWEEYGIGRTIVLMWCLRLAYFLGVDPARLRRHYVFRPSRMQSR